MVEKINIQIDKLSYWFYISRNNGRKKAFFKGFKKKKKRALFPASLFPVHNMDVCLFLQVNGANDLNCYWNMLWTIKWCMLA